MSDGISTKLEAQAEEELRDWVMGIMYGRPNRPGRFLESLAIAVLYADSTNSHLLRPALIQLKAKYPEYSYRAAKEKERASVSG